MMWPKILTYVPPSREQKRSRKITGRGNTISGTEKPIKQYRRRMLPYLSADFKWMCLWMALLLAIVLVMAVVDGGAQ